MSHSIHKTYGDYAYECVSRDEVLRNLDLFLAEVRERAREDLDEIMRGMEDGVEEGCPLQLRFEIVAVE